MSGFFDSSDEGESSGKKDDMLSSMDFFQNIESNKEGFLEKYESEIQQKDEECARVHDYQFEKQKQKDEIEKFMKDIKKEEESKKRSKGEIMELEDYGIDAYVEMKKKRGKQKEEVKSDNWSALKEMDVDSLLEEYKGADGTKMKRVFKHSLENSLKPIEHDKVVYEKFEKNFYSIHKDTKEQIDGILNKWKEDGSNADNRKAMNPAEKLQAEIGIKVGGFKHPAPISKFSHCFSDYAFVMDVIKNKEKFEEPTPIQRQVLPTVLSGRDVIGISETGSGKTFSYLWPMVVHIMHQREIKKGEGPVGLIIVPSRELCQQVEKALKHYAIHCSMRVLSIYGGVSKSDQFKALHKGCDVVIATPGRFIDMLRMKACVLFRTTFLVIDEADKMFDIGFESQIRAILEQTRPDRQTLLFSATFNSQVEKLARNTLNDPVRIVAGQIGKASSNITQYVSVLESDDDKWDWLLNEMPSLYRIYQKEFEEEQKKKNKSLADKANPNGEKSSSKKINETLPSTLVFVSSKEGADALASNLCSYDYLAVSIHGDKTQEERDDIVSAFRNGTVNILIGTDIVARGLDIPHVKIVVNYDVPKNFDTYIHRIGRAGRVKGVKGDAYTLVTQKESIFAGQLLVQLEQSSQDAPDELFELAMKNAKFRARRMNINTSSAFSLSNNKQSKQQRQLSERIKKLTKRNKNEGLGFESKESKKTASNSFKMNTNMFQSMNTFRNTFVKSDQSSEETPSEKQKFIVIHAKNPKKRDPPPPAQTSQNNGNNSEKDEVFQIIQQSLEEQPIQQQPQSFSNLNTSIQMNQVLNPVMGGVNPLTVPYSNPLLVAPQNTLAFAQYQEYLREKELKKQKKREHWDDSSDEEYYRRRKKKKHDSSSHRSRRR